VMYMMIMNKPEESTHKESSKRNPAEITSLINNKAPAFYSYPYELQKALVDHLSGFMTERRNQIFRSIASQRTRYITVVLEDIFQSHNASAVLRSCECFGIQDVHFIENRYQYELNPDIALGSWKWLTLNRYSGSADNTSACLTKLKSDGYRIIATTPHKRDTTPVNLDLNKGKIALLFGTELEGLSANALSLADEYLKIPMTGFTESLNISVSAALIVHQLTERLRSSSINWQMEENEITALLLQWMRNSIKMSESIEKKFITNSNFQINLH
jgi:tRNA (guanosine-2'-O-)-methyltransferase